MSMSPKNITHKEIANYLKEVFDGDKLYQSNFRGWDFEMIMEHGEFDKEDVVLDTGALQSYFSVYLAQFVKAVFATDDFSWAERDYYPKSGLPAPEEWMRTVADKTDGKVIGEEADVRQLPYKTGNFDKILSISTIEHVDDDESAMREMIRVLKPGGLLLMTTEHGLTPKDYSEKDGSYYRIYDTEQLLQLTSCDDTFTEEVIIAPTAEEDYKKRKFTTIFYKIRKAPEGTYLWFL